MRGQDSEARARRQCVTGLDEAARNVETVRPMRSPIAIRLPLARSVAPLAALAAALLALGSCGPLAPPRGAAFDPDTVPEAHARATAALMWTGATRAFLITPEGDLANGDWRVRLTASAGGVAAAAPRAIAAEDRWMPVLRWNRHAGAVRFEFEAVASPQPAPRDSGLLVSLTVRAVNTGAAPADVRLDAVLAPRAAGDGFVAPDAPETTAPLAWAGDVPGAPAQGWCADAAREPARVALAWHLAPGGARSTRFLLPTYPERAGDLAQWARQPHAARAAATRRYWTGELERGLQLELGDREVEDAVRAARVVLLSCMERRPDAWVPIGNPFQYRDVWVRDGARAVRALAVSGHVRDARSLTDGLMLFQWPSGAFLSQRGQLDGTGQVLWALDQSLTRPDVDADRVGRAADAALAAVRWIETQRGIGALSGWEYGAMLPFAEPRDAELVRAQLVGSDAWAIAGERAAAHLLRAAGRPAEADSVEGSLRRYRAALEAALERSGSPDVPPSWQGVGRDWGNLSIAVPCGALPLEHPRVAAMARRVWARAGGAGLDWYGTPDSLHTYLATDLAVWAALTGRPASADSVLAALLHWRTASGGAGEIVSRSSRDFGANLPPHATAAAALVSLVRDLLVYDESDTLVFTAGARSAWWRGGAVRGAPTHFGRIDLEFARTAAGAQWRWTPVRTWVALTLPPGTRLAGPPTPPLRADARPDRVLAPPMTREARVALATAEAR
jgi:hypothetical protein